MRQATVGHNGGGELLPVLVVSLPAQLKAFAHPTRVRIIELLIERPLTVKQLGDLLGMSAARAHYHLKFLEGAGLVRLVERRERAGVVEKYYRAASRKYIVGSSLGTFGEPGSVILEALAAAMLRGAVSAVRGAPVGLVAGANERVAVRPEDMAGLLGVANALQAAQDEMRGLDGGSAHGSQIFELTYALYATGQPGSEQAIESRPGPELELEPEGDSESKSKSGPKSGSKSEVKSGSESEPDATC